MGVKNKKGVSAKLDRIVGKWCREVRNNGKCEVCESDKNLQWCHIKSRRYLSVRWSPNNCLCLCAKCHFYFTDHPDFFGEWLYDNRQFQLYRLQEQYKSLVKTNETWRKGLLENIERELSLYRIEDSGLDK